MIMMNQMCYLMGHGLGYLLPRQRVAPPLAAVLRVLLVPECNRDTLFLGVAQSGGAARERSALWFQYTRLADAISETRGQVAGMIEQCEVVGVDDKLRLHVGNIPNGFF